MWDRILPGQRVPGNRYSEELSIRNPETGKVDCVIRTVKGHVPSVRSGHGGAFSTRKIRPDTTVIVHGSSSTPLDLTSRPVERVSELLAAA